jgi:hypothetical protein
MEINFNPATPEGQQQLQTQGVKLISKIPYGGTDSPFTAQPTANERARMRMISSMDYSVPLE